MKKIRLIAISALLFGVTANVAYSQTEGVDFKIKGDMTGVFLTYVPGWDTGSCSSGDIPCTGTECTITCFTNTSGRLDQLIVFTGTGSITSFTLAVNNYTRHAVNFEINYPANGTEDICANVTPTTRWTPPPGGGPQSVNLNLHAISSPMTCN